MREAVAPNQMTDRAFGRDVDGIHPRLGNAPSDLPDAWHSDPNARIARQRDARKSFGRQEGDLCAQRIGRPRSRLQGVDHAIDLRPPSIGRDQNPHQSARARQSGRTAVRLRRLPQPPPRINHRDNDNECG